MAARSSRIVTVDPVTAPALVATKTPEAPVTLFGRTVEYKWLVATVLVSALFLDILDTTIVNVALPTLGRQFGASSTDWVVIGYTLSLAVFIPASGWLSDRIGSKRVFLFAFAMFIGSSALCGAAQSIEQLIAFRVLQGVGGGMLTPAVDLLHQCADRLGRLRARVPQAAREP